MIIFKTHHKLLFAKVYRYIIIIGNLSRAKISYVLHNIFFLKQFLSCSKLLKYYRLPKTNVQKLKKKKIKNSTLNRTNRLLTFTLFHLIHHVYRTHRVVTNIC